MLTFKQNNKINHKMITKKVSLKGWIHSIRNHGGVFFIDLRDSSGIIQLVTNQNSDNNLIDICNTLKEEYVIEIKGTVVKRKEELVNPNLETGKLEVVLDDITILNTSKTLPFSIKDRDNVNKELRLKYRYLDLRNKESYDIFKLKSDISFLVRKYFIENDFIEISTPILTKSTPEGARDYIVPSRVQNEKFYALPQSPQLFKQLLMSSGFDKYFQFAKCFRDEDLRADRQPEFEQIDLEMSFVDKDNVMFNVENIMLEILNFVDKNINQKTFNFDLKKNNYSGVIPTMTYDFAMETFGSDKPDLRFDLPFIDVKKIFKNSDFEIFKKISLDDNNTIKALVLKNGENLVSRKDQKDLEDFVCKFGAKGLAYFQVLKDNDDKIILKGPLEKFLSKQILDELIEKCDLEENDRIFFGAGNKKITLDYMGRFRLELANKYNLIENINSLLWVTDFPMFEKDNGKIKSMHHPFTKPNLETFELYENGKIDIEDILSESYDLVYNGVEVGGGSIRIHNIELQNKIFKILGFNENQIKENFGFFVESLEYGTPPHGGFAFGFDRLIMLINELNTIRDVIAFPKTQNASCLISDAPNSVSDTQLKEVGIRFHKKI